MTPLRLVPALPLHQMRVHRDLAPWCNPLVPTYTLQAARSSLSCRFSRRRFLSSSPSTLLSTSSRFPASASVWATQLRMVCAEHSNSLDSSCAFRPARTKATTLRRYSGGYATLDLGIFANTSPCAEDRVSTKPGRLQTSCTAKTRHEARTKNLIACILAQ